MTERADQDERAPGPGGRARRLHICFVCTGNICRSPMADVVLQHLAAGAAMPDGSTLADRLRVTSGGTGGWHAGHPMDDRARAALERRGYADHGHRARRFESAWFPWTDLVVCLDRGHRQTLAGLARAHAGDDHFDERLVLLRSFDPAAGANVDVPDPYYEDDTGFDACLAMVESGCRGLVGHLGSRLADTVGPASGPAPQSIGTKDAAS
ncbi:MAG: low molecular weight protein-tyrosine-phosphatase [Acidimicrobiales bacterium]